MSEKSILPYTSINLLFYCFYIFKDFLEEKNDEEIWRGWELDELKSIINFKHREWLLWV